MDATTARVRMLSGFDSRVVEVGGVLTSLVEAGAGPPLLVLHGGIECGGAMWAPVLARLAERHRVVVPDLPGLGESAPVHRLDTDAFGRWLTALLECCDLRRPTLVAHSLVGSLAARFATRRSDLLGRLVVYAAPGVGPYRMPLGLRYVAVRAAIRPTARNTERFNRFALLDLDATFRRDTAWFEAFVAYTRARGAVPHVKATMRSLLAAGTTPIPDSELARITAPTALLWGRHDRMVPLPLAERAAERHGWPLHIVQDTAHAPHVERPREFVEALV